MPGHLTASLYYTDFNSSISVYLYASTIGYMTNFEQVDHWDR